MSSIPSPTNSPLLLDTLLLLLLQTLYFLLSRRFLLSTLPTLRQISSSPDSAAAQEAFTALPVDGTASPGGPGGRYVNATGGSEPPSPRIELRSLPGRPGLGRSRSDGVGEESDDSDGYSYAGSPAPATPMEELEMPLLPLHTSSSSPSLNLNRFETSTGGHGKRQSQSSHSQISSSSSSSSNPPAPTPATTSLDGLGTRLAEVAGQGLSGKRRILRVFNGSRKKEGERGRGRGKERVTTTRGLGWVARNLFSWCFSQSLILLSLVMFHGIGLLHSRSRHLHFSIGLHILLFLILFAVPLVQCLQLTYRTRDIAFSSSTSPTHRSLSLSKRLLISLIPFTLYLFLFTRIPPYITTQTSLPTLPIPSNTTLPLPLAGGIKNLPSKIDLGNLADLEDEPLLTEDPLMQEGWQKGGWLEPSLGRVVVCGVIVLGCLSGLGAVRTAWGFFEEGAVGGKNSRIISREDILAAERSLFRIRHDIVAKKDEIAMKTKDTTLDAGSGGGGGYIFRVFGGGGGGDASTSAVRRELQGLQALEPQVKRSLEAMKIRKNRQKFARTLRGKIYNIVGVCFAAYCIARIAMCLTSVFFPPLATSQVNTENTTRKGNTNGDWISFLIALGLSQLPNGLVDVNVGSRAISLLLTGLLILSSLAQVLRSVSRILRLTSKSVGAGFLLLGLGQLMSTYVISLLIQLRTQLPPTLHEGFASHLNSTSPDAFGIPTHIDEDPSLLASLPDFRIFGRLFDIMFLVAACSAAVFRYVGMKMNGADDSGDMYH